MNCNELKNLLLEISEITEITSNPEASSHIRNCSQCRAAVAHEQKLRNAFNDIAQHQPPAFLAARIMSVQTNSVAAQTQTSQPGIIEKIREIFSVKNLSIAMAAGLTGFIAATLIFRTPAYQPDKSAEIKTTILSLKNSEQTNQISTEKNKTAEFTEGGVQYFKESAAALSPEPSDPAVQDTIPGAVSFALKSEEHVLFEDSSFKTEAAEEGFMLAKSDGAGYSAAPAARAFSPATSLESNKKEMLHREHSETDPGAEMLLAILEKFDIEIPDGLIKIEELAMRGFIDAAQLKKLQPAAGNAWFLESSETGKKVFLKKKQ